MDSRILMSCTLAGFACVSCATCACADELWRQDPINSFGGMSSQDARNAGGLGWFSEVVDDFAADEDWTVDAVQFWGGYANVVPGNTHGFMIRVYENDGGAVGALVDTQDVMTFTETQYYAHPSLGLPGYHYTLDLNSAVPLPAGDYWLSVVAILDRGGGANEPQWGWIDAIGVSGSFAMQRFFSPTFNLQNKDVSFVLEGTVDDCYADCDANGLLNILDYICFGDDFAAGGSYADCDGSGSLNILDYICYGDAFSAGCP